jgi:benzoylformate decarboxylase
MTGPALPTVREASFALLRDFGLTCVFGNPGSTELPMFRDFPADFRYVLGLQESVVVGLADGYAQAHGGGAVVNLHSAVGVGHALGAIFTAYRNQTPLLIIAGQQARSMLPFEPFLYSEQAANLPRPYVKWSCEPARAEDVPQALARAWYTAMQAPRGPAFVSVPVDDWERHCEPVAARRVATIVAGDPELLAQAARALAAARRPVIVAGAGIARDGAWDEVVALAERHEAPVWIAPRASRDAFPERHRLFAGFLPPERAALAARLAGYDLVLVLGAPVFTYHMEGHGPHLPAGAQLVQLGDDPAAAAWAGVGTSIVTDLRLGIGALLRSAPAQLRDAPRLPARASLPETDAHAPGAPSEAYLMQQIDALRPSGSIIVEEAPSSRATMQALLPMTERGSFHTCASGGLGHGLPAAVGVALARPQRKVIALLGDGSAMYSIQGLWTAAELRLPVAFVIVNNGSYEALVEFGEHFSLAQLPGTQLPHLDFCALAQGHGVAALRVERREQLPAALAQAFAANEPMLVDVRIAPRRR